MPDIAGFLRAHDPFSGLVLLPYLGHQRARQEMQAAQAHR